MLYKISVSCAAVFLSFSAVYYFPLTYSTSMRNMSPFFALIFSAICAGESPTLNQTLLLTVMTALVLCFVLPQYESGG